MMPSGALFVHLSHVMRELLNTERVYVDELLSVLLVRGIERDFLLFIKQIHWYCTYGELSPLKGYRAEMDNPALVGLLPPILHSKRDILFGNMPEIYKFHSRLHLPSHIDPLMFKKKLADKG